MSNSMFQKSLIGIVLGSTLLAGCNDSTQTATDASQMPPPEVDTIKVVEQTIHLKTALPGRTSAFRIAEVRPQVSGIITKRLFKEGSEVKAGQVLYQISPATYEAAVANAKAGLAKAKNNEESSRQKEQRYQRLLKVSAVSQQEYDDVKASWLQAKADVDVEKALLDSALINLRYTQIRAPITGLIGISSFTEGALVTAEQANVLAVIQQIDPLYVDIHQSSSALAKLRKSISADNLHSNPTSSLTVDVFTDETTDKPITGKMKFSDVTVDSGTGNITMRAIVPNKDRNLLPGLFVKAELNEVTLNKAILIPQEAVSHDPKGNAIVLTVNQQNIVESKIVTTVQSYKNQWVVSSGVEPGEQVIVRGFQSTQPSASVHFTTVEQVLPQNNQQ